MITNTLYYTVHPALERNTGFFTMPEKTVLKHGDSTLLSSDKPSTDTWASG
jgi:hypothetical protein